jgi:hypothetical protein
LEGAEGLCLKDNQRLRSISMELSRSIVVGSTPGKPGGIQGVTMRLRTRNGGSRMTYIRFLGSACVVLLLVAAAVAQESYDQVLHHCDYDKNTPLNIKQAGIGEGKGVTIYDISSSSPVGDRSAAVGPNGGKVTAYLVVPSGQGRFPAVIFGHLRRRIAPSSSTKLSCSRTLGSSHYCPTM